MKQWACILFPCLGLMASAVAATSTSVIAHRGASGYLPEHTLAAYAMAYAQGADFIEPDLVLTRDGILVARHEAMLDDTTDVAERFPDRRAADGHFYAADLDYAELATLRAREYREGRFPRTARLFPVPRFEDVITLVSGLNAVTGCSVGLYPELKSPGWHLDRGLDPVAALRRALAAQPFDAALRIQSFEPEALEALAAEPIEGAVLVQLIGSREQVTPSGLAHIATYADAIGPSITHLTRALEAGDDIVARAHALDLNVDAWTLRADALGAFADFSAAVAFTLHLGVDGIFTDHPDHLVHHLTDRKETPPCMR